MCAPSILPRPKAAALLSEDPAGRGAGGDPAWTATDLGPVLAAAPGSATRSVSIIGALMHLSEASIVRGYTHWMAFPTPRSNDLPTPSNAFQRGVSLPPYTPLALEGFQHRWKRWNLPTPSFAFFLSRIAKHGRGEGGRAPPIDQSAMREPAGVRSNAPTHLLDFPERGFSEVVSTTTADICHLIPTITNQ